MSVMRCLAACLVVFAVSSCVLAQTARFTMLEAAPDWDDLVRPSVVMAEVLTDTPAYSSWDGGGSRTCTFHAGETVEVVRDHGFQWYLIRAGDGREGWVQTERWPSPVIRKPTAIDCPGGWLKSM